MSAVPSTERDLLAEVTVLARAYTESQAFVALLAHEVRTRLKVTERALAGADEAGLRIAGENTRALQELVEGLLELARARPDARAECRRGDALGLARSWRHVSGPTSWSASCRWSRCSLALLRTVLRNLVTNALEAGASTVEVYARADGAICVRDDGPGVPPAVAAKIFGAYSSKFGGAGLGLGLCREILRQRRGELWLERPSTFCFHV